MSFRKNKSSVLVLAAIASGFTRVVTHDVAYGFRMGAGFPGDVNRSLSSIVPNLTDSTDVIQAYGNPVLNKTSSNLVKGFVAADSTTPVICAGFCVRPMPSQQQAQSNFNTAIGAAAPPTSGVVDIIKRGFVMCKLPAGVSVTKGGLVYVWFAVTSGNNIQGGLVGAASAGNAALITNAKFNGPADANGNVEVEVWPQG